MSPESCRHGMPPDRCSLCKAPPGDHYELRRGSFEGNPVVEIMKNGGPVHRHDEHFRFGLEKARLLLVAEPVIDQFLQAGDQFSLARRTLTDPERQTTMVAWVQLEPEFVRSTGETLDRPYLYLESQRSSARIGIGYEKAKALRAVRAELRAWVAKPAG